VKEGILPGMLWQQYKARKAIKKLMDAAKAAGNMIMYVTYNAQQLAVKVSMNASYGALGTASNRLACYPAAETITYIGRMAILKCNDWIEKNNPDDDVVYNDTDSGFVRLKNITKRFNRNIKAIKEYGEGLAASLAKLFPKPMGMEMENVFISLFLKAPKMYAGIKCDGQSLDIEHYTWDYINTMNLLYVKGLAPVRNDKYKYNKELFNRILYMTLVRANVMQLIYTLEKGI
jgi:DNA polymerase elongation subunit (family B)